MTEDTSAATTTDPRPVLPKPPRTLKCNCTGCDNCFIDAYKMALQKYHKELAVWEKRQQRPVTC